MNNQLVVTIAELNQRFEAWRRFGFAYVVQFPNGRWRSFKPGQLRAAVDQVQRVPGAQIHELAFAHAESRPNSSKKGN